MLEVQDNKCAACGKVFLGTHQAGPCVDHDHRTGEVRSLLCKACNTSLGAMDEDPNRLIALASYIAQYKEP